MNRKILKPIVSSIAILFAWATLSAQENETLYVMKQGEVDFKVVVSDIDSITFGNKDPFDKEITGPVIAYSDGGTAEMTNPFFWVNFAQDKGINTDAVILTTSEIASFTQSLANQSNLRLTLPSSLANETTVTYSNLTSLASTYGYTSSPKRLTDYVSSFSDNRNVQFGIITSFSQMYSYPAVTTETSYLETGLEVCEGVVIYAEYEDFYLVKSQNYFGWVLKTTVGTCSKADFANYATPSDFVVVTAERLPTSLGLPTMLRMGTKLPMSSQSGNNVSFVVPTRTASGALSSTVVSLPIDQNEYIHIGYLPYTAKNLLKQMFKMLGQVYGWGDQNGNRDCSSTVWTAYKCCGFLLPRNTGQMQNMPAGAYCKSINGNHTTIMNALNGSTYRPGTIVLMSGHVVMYLGLYEGNHYIIHSSSSSRASCKVTGLNIYSSLTHIKAIEK